MEAARPALEHRSSRSGRWLRARRVQLALWIAVAEVVLLVLGVVPVWQALAVGLLLVAFHLAVGRRLPWDAARQGSWIAATSQVFAALAPALVFALGLLALVVVMTILAVAAVVAVVFVAARRRR